MKLIIWYFLGILLCISGLFFIIINLNLLTIGYTFASFCKYLLTHLECLNFIIGLIILIIVYERGLK